jgi:S-adenosylmethionine decarboxylase
MAYTDALFQLGMDLTRSSTAQKEDHGQSALVAHDDREDCFVERGGVRCAGTHFIVDLYGAKRLDDLKHIKETLRRCVEAAGANLLHIHLHRFTDNGGVSGVAVLAEGHLSIHSWPDKGSVALDAFMGRDAKPELAIEAAKQAFRPTRAVVKEHLRADTAQGRPLKAISRKPQPREKARAAA